MYTAIREDGVLHATAYPRTQSNECAICLSPLFEGALAVTDCTHLYHYDCIADWVDRQPTCPLCRTHIDPPHIIELIEQ